jgi:hypothetical protein
LGDAEAAQVNVEPGVVEGASSLLGHEVIARLGVEVIDEVGPVES